MSCALICECYNDEISLLVVGMGVKNKVVRGKGLLILLKAFYFSFRTPRLAEARNVFATE